MIELEREDYERGMRSLAAIARRGSRFPAPASGVPSPKAMNVCIICGNMWQAGSRPERCPSCRSTMWNRHDLHRHICKSCSHRWVSAIESPKRCPSCHTRNWDTDSRRYECASCGHRMSSPLDREGPSHCPECGSAAWGCDRVSCSCSRCGFVGNIMPGRPGKCPLCGTAMSPNPKHSGDRAGRVLVDSKAAEILRSGYDERTCIGVLMDSLGATETEAKAMYLLCSGSGEVAAARELNVSFDYVRRVSKALSDQGAVRRAADASV